MKKLIILFAAIVLSLGTTFAESSCRVYGSNDGNVASINRPIQLAGSVGEITYTVQLTNKATSQIAVVVEVWYNGNIIATDVVTFPEGWDAKYNQKIILGKSMEGKEVKLSIAKATCE